MFYLHIHFPFQMVSSFNSCTCSNHFLTYKILYFFANLQKNILSVEKLKLFILFNNLSLFVFIHNYFSCLVIIWMQSMFNG